jgi:hypothetical protein
MKYFVCCDNWRNVRSFCVFVLILVEINGAINQVLPEKVVNFILLLFFNHCRKAFQMYDSFCLIAIHDQVDEIKYMQIVFFRQLNQSLQLCISLLF